MPTIVDMVMDLMDRHQWLTASIARWSIEHDVDIDYYANLIEKEH